MKRRGRSGSVNSRAQDHRRDRNRHNEPPKFPAYAEVSQRINSFQQGEVSPGHTAERLADAGWFWTGLGDKVMCFQCGGNLKDWEPEDDPWEEHKRWYANCPYIKTRFPAPRQQFQESVHQMSRASGNENSSANTFHGNQLEHEREIDLVEKFRSHDYVLSLYDYLPGPNPSARHPITTGIQVEDCVVATESSGTPLDALMEREEVHVVQCIMEDFGFNRSDLEALVRERLSREEDCLIPTVLLDAAMNKYGF